MKENAILNKVRELLGMELKLEQKKLDDGVTIVEAETFEAGAEVFVVTEDEQKIALPVGECKMEEGMLLIVKEEGKIAEIKEQEEAEEEEKEKEMKEKEAEVKEEEMQEEKPVKKTVESIVKETFFNEIEALKKENEELKAEIELLSKPKTEEAVELTEEVKEVQEELTPATEPITHNPENKQEHIYLWLSIYDLSYLEKQIYYWVYTYISRS